MKITVTFENVITGEIGTIIEWERPRLTSREFKIIMLELTDALDYDMMHGAEFPCHEIAANIYPGETTKSVFSCKQEPRHTVVAWVGENHAKRRFYVNGNHFRDMNSLPGGRIDFCGRKEGEA